jgi:two-component system KDP operon response regulator KdpE
MTTQPLLLAVDDEAGILRLLRLELKQQGFTVLTAANATEAMQVVEERRPDLILLDIMMPGESGLEFLRKVRARSNTPIILVTAKDREQDRVRGLELGADDYIVKPFNLAELVARVRAVLRRGENRETASVVKSGDVEVDFANRAVRRRGEPVNMTRTEWMLLQHLAANSGSLVTNVELLTKVWGPEYRDDLQYLRVWVSRIRQKLEDTPSEPKVIKTFQGLGYMFAGDGTPQLEGERSAAEPDASGEDAPEAPSKVAEAV